MKQAVTRTRENLSERIDEVMAFTKVIDRSTLDDLEGILIGADLGTKTTQEILGKLRERLIANKSRCGGTEATDQRTSAGDPERHAARTGKPAAGDPEVGWWWCERHGQDHSIGKLAHALRGEGKSVLLCAADTSALPPLSSLKSGDRERELKSQDQAGGDPSAVLYDALSAAKARHVDSVIVDTAGRLHTKTSLMAELGKMKRTAQRIIPARRMKCCW